MNAVTNSIGKFRSFMAFIPLMLCGLIGFAGCSAHQLATTQSAASQVQAVSQANNPTGPAATQPAVIFARPIVQAVGTATGPLGETTLSILAGIAGLVVAGITQYRSAVGTARHQAAVAELHSVLSPAQQTALSPATKRIVAQTAS